MVVYGRIMVVCGVGFGSILVGVWLAMGCGVARGGFVGWLAVVVPIFSGFPWFCVWIFVVVLFCFTSLQTHNVEYFSKHFPRMQTNTEKKLFSPKSFAFENILQCKMFYIETNEALKSFNLQDDIILSLIWNRQTQNKKKCRTSNLYIN